MKKIDIYSDGACKGNPGPGGWGALLRYSDKEKQIYGGELDTTNNRMELRAAIEALSLVKEPCEVTLTTDSDYVRRGISEWIRTWKQNGWRTSNKQAVKNRDLWQRLDELASIHKIQWVWVKGHSGHPENELVDQLANRGVAEIMAGAAK